MDARGTCDGRHRARKSCPDPECYLRDAPGLKEERVLEEPRPGVPNVMDEDRAALRKLYDGADNLVATDEWRPKDHGGLGQPSEEHADPRHERPPTIDEQVADVARLVQAEAAKLGVEVTAVARVSLAEMDALNARATMAPEPIEFGPGIYRWACTRDGGYQRTEYAHELPPCPAGWRWSSAQVTAVGGRGKLHVSAAVVDGSEGANAASGPQSLVLEITGRGGYCTSLDVVLFARPV